jgi:F-type H+-transporting ATPase subunit b
VAQPTQHWGTHSPAASKIEREKENLINATSISLEQLEKSKNDTLYFEKQRAMNQVRQNL